jgi:protein SOK2
VQTRGPADVPYYNHHAAQRPLYVNDRLPSLPLPQPQQAYSSGTSSPRVGSLSSLGSSSILNGSSHSSYTTASSSNGPKTPSPTPASSGLPVSLPQASYSTPPSNPAYSYSQEPYTNNMNHGAQDMYYPSHMSAGQQPPPQTVTSGSMAHYSQHQPPLLQPGPAQYSPAQQGPYNQYYGNGLQSPQSAQVPGTMGGQGTVLPLPAMTTQPGMPNQGYPTQGFDQTGQVAPPGMKPRVTATLWEDEGSLCFQVEAKGVCVARREGE